MTSLIKRQGYSDRFDRSSRRFALAFPDAAQFLQSDELDGMQSLQDDKLQRVAEHVLQDGRKVTSGDPVIAAIAGDDIYVDVRLPRASISIAGLVHDVAEARFALPRDGDVSLGVRVTETLQDSVSDIGLRGRLPGTEAFMEPGAARIRLDVAWGHSADGIAAPPLI